ncbi:MAG TPA: hypothetical protein VNJ11_04230 [Bryobacteraceae bacterium]|nr:hypothetical protein [Bryobacteraceae bacterium]
MAELRLGDIIDDYCVKCKGITNHSVVSLVNQVPAKVRCRTCYNDHDYRHAKEPPKKEKQKKELFKAVLASIDPSSAVTEEEKSRRKERD